MKTIVGKVVVLGYQGRLCFYLFEYFCLFLPQFWDRTINYTNNL